MYLNLRLQCHTFAQFIFRTLSNTNFNGGKPADDEIGLP